MLLRTVTALAVAALVVSGVATAAGESKAAKIARALSAGPSKERRSKSRRTR